MPEIRDYKVDILISNDLENEWLTHPSTYMYYAEEFADACEDRDNAKLKMEWIAATIDLDIRKTWDTTKGYKKYEFDKKPTEGAIKNTILIDKEYQTAYKTYNKAVKKVNSMTGIKTAFEHKKHALANLVSLKIGGFYAEPRNKIQDVKKLAGANVHEKQQEVLNEKMKRRKEAKLKKVRKVKRSKSIKN